MESNGKSVTLGAVVQLADRASLSIDLYEISLTDMVASQSVDSIYTQCFSPDVNPTYDPNTFVNAPFSGGSVLVRGASSPAAGTGVRVVLQGNGSGAYHVLTGFPVP